MAKRRRLSPAATGIATTGTAEEAQALAAALLADRETEALFPRGPRPPGAPLQPIPGPVPPPLPAPRPPIARVAGESAAEAALAEVAAELAAARAEGRLVLALPLDAVDAGYLLRDRIAADPEETASLIESLRTHGQRVPIDVTDLGGGRYGLVSGYRRLAALKALLAETGEARFATVAALVRRPETAAAAYVAMVEENEIRAGLSYWERGRIALRAAEAGVFPDLPAALRALYGAASRARRSKIGTFAGLVAALDGVLRFPTAVPERLGLALAQALEAGRVTPAGLAAALADAAPADAAAEQAVLARALAAQKGPQRNPRKAPKPEPERLGPGLRLEVEPGRIVIAGAGADAALAARIRAFLAGAGAG
jgi:ParB-like chromosome segregation protein Spo0J